MWQRSAVSSFVELVPVILSQPGVEYFLSEKICQDPPGILFWLFTPAGESKRQPNAE